MAFTLNRLGALILTVNRFAFDKAPENASGGGPSYITGTFFNKYQSQLNSYHSRIFQIFQEILVILTAGSTISKEIILTGQEQPSISQPGTGTLTFDFTLKRFQASENGRKYFDAFPREGTRIFSTANIGTASGAFVALTFTNARFDPFSMFSAGTPSRITIVRSGRYNIGGCVEFANAAAGYRELGIRLNGVTFLTVQSTLPVGAVTRLNVSSDYEFTSGDYIELVSFQNTGGALNVNAAGNYSPEFWCARVHDQPV